MLKEMTKELGYDEDIVDQPDLSLLWPYNREVSQQHDSMVMVQVEWRQFEQQGRAILQDNKLEVTCLV